MHAYKFELEDADYYILGESTLKDRVIKKQGKEKLEKINAEIQKRYKTKYGYSIPYGTVLDENFEVVSSPDTTQSRATPNDEVVKYKITDATFIHLYRLNGKTMIGTRNSWDITNSYDLYSNFTYGDALTSCLSKLGLTIDDLPNGSYAFSHPLIHLLSKEYRLYSFNIEAIGDVSLRFDPATTDEYMSHYPNLGIYHETCSDEYEQLRKLLYYNRQRFRYEDDKGVQCDEISLINCMLNFQCNSSREVKDYVHRNKSFNDVALSGKRFVDSVTKSITSLNPNSTTYYSVTIPPTKNRSVVANYNFVFWREVLANAYWNAVDKGKTIAPDLSSYF